MKTVLLELELLQPVLATQPDAGEENASMSYSFIPGSMIRGALIARYLHQRAVADLAGDDLARGYFFGDLKFLNAYPADANGQRMLPVPASWRVQKGKKSPVYDFAVEEQTDLSRPQSPSAEFTWFNPGAAPKASLIRPGRYLVVHNQSLERGIKRESSSQVFRYEALAPNQILVAAVVGEKAAELLEKLNIVEGEKLYLGGSRQANYGLVQVKSVKPAAEWKEAPAANTDLDGKIIVTFLSDAILCGPSGEPVMNLDTHLQKDHLLSFTPARLVGGFNRKWGLPLPQAISVRAGSVLIYPADDACMTRLKDWEKTGIGQRLEDGFGRIAVNWLGAKRYLPCPQYFGVSRASGPMEEQDLGEKSRQLAVLMANRRLRAQLEQRLQIALNLIEIQSPPTSSQLSSLRSAARIAWHNHDLTVIREHVAALKSAAPQVARARVRYRLDRKEFQLDKWLSDEVQDATGNGTNRLWSKFFENPPVKEFAGTSPDAATLQAMKVEFIARLLDGLFQRTAKFNQREKVSKGETE